MRTEQLFDAIGIGIGPSNLSLAALLAPVTDLRTLFFERCQEFQWHPGLLFPDAQIQVSYLKDLVTLADPTSHYSFLSFLHQNKRLYRFTNADFPRIRRREFNQYFQWVAKQLSNLVFGKTVEAVTFEDSLVVHVASKCFATRHLVMGTGLSPAIPPYAVPYLGETLFHASQYLHKRIQAAGKGVVVIGGGQTGAEIVAHLLSDSTRLPRELFWISRRTNFLPLDESPFTNELFTPSYSEYFFGLPRAAQEKMLSEQKLAGVGIATSQLTKLSQRLYELEFLEGAPCISHLWPGRVLQGLNGLPSNWGLEVYDPLTGAVQVIRGDLVIFCTGYNYSLPPYIEPIAPRIHFEDGRYQVNEDFSIAWDGAPKHKIYLQNAARHARGIADPHLSLMAWRSAKIANSLSGRGMYETDDGGGLIDWATGHALSTVSRQSDSYNGQIGRTVVGQETGGRQL
jgi:lysine N6-hydroxylase